MWYISVLILCELLINLISYLFFKDNVYAAINVSNIVQNYGLIWCSKFLELFKRRLINGCMVDWTLSFINKMINIRNIVIIMLFTDRFFWRQTVDILGMDNHVLPYVIFNFYISLNWFENCNVLTLLFTLEKLSWWS